MAAAIALYKGPAKGLTRTLGHWAIRLWTWSRWSHAELVIDGVCYSSSMRDGGVRAKAIELDSGHWDVLPIVCDEGRALVWFRQHQGQAYDWANIARFLLPFLPQRRDEWVCFEAVAAMLGLAGAHKLTANDLYDWAAGMPGIGAADAI